MAVLLAGALLPVTAAVALDEPAVELAHGAVAAQPSAPWHLDRVDGVDDGAYSYGPLGQGVYIYVIDSGVAYDHPDFTGRVLELPGSDFVDGDDTPRPCPPSEGGEGGRVAHGTHVASTAAGFGYGIAKEATIVPLRIFDCDASSSGVLSALAKVADHNAAVGYPPAVVNMSLGARCGGNSCDADPLSAEYDSGAKVWLDAIEPLLAQGIVVVVSAGNEGSTAKPLACQNAPAFLGAGRDGVITVGNMTQSGNRKASSSYGECVDIYAPGTGVTAADDRDSTGAATIHGTSMAAPMVTGAVALLLSENPGLTPAERPANVWNRLSSYAAAFSSDQSPDAALQLRLPSYWAGRSATTAGTGYASLVFDEDVSGLEAGDISFEGTATGCVAGIAGASASRYSVDVTCATDGTVVPVLAADSVISLADASTAPGSNQRLTQLTFDRSVPGLTGGPTVVSFAGDQVTYELEIDEPVFGLSLGDFSTSGTATGCSVSRVTGSGAYYKVVVTCASNGSVVLTLSAEAVRDLAGNNGPASATASSAYNVVGVPVASSPASEGGGSSGSATATTVPAASAGAESFTPATTIVPATGPSRNPVATTPSTVRAPSVTKPAPAPVLEVVESLRGPLKGSTISVGTRRIAGSIAGPAGGAPVVVQVRDAKGRVVRTLTVDARKSGAFTIFVPAGTYRLTLRGSGRNAATWTLSSVKVPR